MWYKRTHIYVTVLVIAVASCNAEEELKVKTSHLPSKSSDRIVGGTNTTIEQYPFTVQILYVGRLFCGGSLITSRHVLSAAHCFVKSKRSLSILVGSTYLYQGGTLHRISEIIIHESYNKPHKLENDIAVAFMSSPAKLSTRVATVPIPRQGAMVPDNSSLIAVGWGSTLDAKIVNSPVLKEATTRKVSHSVCQMHYRMKRIAVTSTMLCAETLDKGGNTCYGDSGGPLLFEGVLVGITSFGYGCAHPKNPAVHTRVANYTQWILNTVRRLDMENCTWSAGSKVGTSTLLTISLFLMLIV